MEKYVKSTVQLQKERERRRKLRNYVISHRKISALNQTALARVAGCSQSTVSRDLKKLASSRWNPFRQIALRLKREQRARKPRCIDELVQIDENTSPREGLEKLKRFKALIHLIYGGGHNYPQHSKPRGKPFTSSYQPRLRRWGLWLFHCLNCGYEGRVEMTGFWRRGQKTYFNCPICGKALEIMRPELPVEKRIFTTPCGYTVVVSTEGRWKRNQPILFNCPKCGKEHHIDKRLTSPV